MIERWLIDNVWIAVMLSIGAYSANYYLGMKENRLYHAGAKNLLVFPGLYDRAPGPPANRRWRDAKFLAGVLILAGAIAAAWTSCTQYYQRPEVFALIIGGLVLFEAASIIRHLRNITLFRYAPNADLLQGKIEYSAWLAHTLFFRELYSFAALYLALFLTVGSWLFLGGALTCFINARRHHDWTVTRT